MPLANDPIMLERSIQLFRHLEHQNPSIISESIGIPNGSKKMGKKVRRKTEERNGGGMESYSEEDYSTTMDKIITSWQILVFEVSK